MSTTFAIEAVIDEHDADLYEAAPVSRALRGLAAVGEKEIAEYHEQGFLVVHGAFTPQKAERARQELERMTMNDDPLCGGVHFESGIWRHLEERGFTKRPQEGGELTEEERAELRRAILALPVEVRASLVRKFIAYTKEHPPLAALANSAALRRVLEGLVGEPVRLFVSQAMIKPPGGREKPWHQDHAYFDFPVETPIVGVWIALDEATPDNGCMRVLPGGHKAGPRIHFKRRDWQICDTDMVAQPIVAVPLSAGDILLFDGKLPHGTPRNRTDQQRWAVQYHYVPKRAEMTSQEARLAVFGSEGKGVYC